MKIKPYIFFLFCCFWVNISIAQDVHFSNLSFNSIYTSVASVGSEKEMIRAAILYRNQWPTIESSYETIGFYTDFKIKLGDNAIGIGLTSNRDEAGALNFTKLNLNGAAAYHQQIGENSHLSGGVQFGFTQHSIIGTKAQWENQYDGSEFDPNLPSGEQPLFQPFMSYNIGAGIMWKFLDDAYRRTGSPILGFDLGLSAYYIGGEPLIYNGGEPEYIKYSLTGNGIIKLGSKYFSLLPAFLYQQKGTEKEFVFGALFKYTITDASKYTNYIKQLDISAGAYYRIPNDALIPTFNITYDKFQFGLSYDINTSKLVKATSSVGGVEFSLRYLFN